MTYITGNLTTGVYDSASLANLGIGHKRDRRWRSLYLLQSKTGQEFSATLGFTYNFENTHTQYQNGIDMHLDLGASQFLTKQLQVGSSAYFYDQLSCDSGSGDRVGCFESRVAGIGPQIGYIIPLSKEYQGYINLKGYKEFAAANRPDGWNMWLTFAITPAAQSEPFTRKTHGHQIAERRKHPSAFSSKRIRWTFVQLDRLNDSAENPAGLKRFLCEAA